MRRWILILCAAVAVSASEPVTVPLWEKGAPGWETRPDREAVEQGTDGQRRVRNVSRPTMKVFLPPAATATGGAVIVCPGGGYVALAIDKEGEDVARWLNSLGVAAAVLRYRLQPTEAGENVSAEERLRRRAEHLPFALEDGRRAVRLVRHRAAEWRIDPRRIAILGFSAGGHLTANVGMNYDAGRAGAADPVDRLSSRPDAIVPIYAGRFEDPVFPAGAPPAFLLHAHDDKTVPSEYTAQMYQALKKAGIPAEMHIYPQGGHGFGIKKTGFAVDQWPERLRDWLGGLGWLKKQ